MKNKEITLTKRETQILDILWNSDKPMSASEIVSSCPELTKSTVTAVLRKLLTSSYIKVSDIVYSGTVLCRRYEPTLSRTKLILSQIKDSIMSCCNEVSKVELFSSLLGDMSGSSISLKEIEEMEKMLAQYKSNLQKR